MRAPQTGLRDSHLHRSPADAWMQLQTIRTTSKPHPNTVGHHLSYPSPLTPPLHYLASPSTVHSHHAAGPHSRHYIVRLDAEITHQT